MTNVCKYRYLDNRNKEGGGEYSIPKQMYLLLLLLSYKHHWALFNKIFLVTCKHFINFSFLIELTSRKLCATDSFIIK